MAKSNYSSSVYYDGFEGIDLRKCHNGKESSALIENFRIRQDGSLEKRCGYKPVLRSPSLIRTLWIGNLGDENVCIYLCGAYVYAVDTSDYSQTHIGSVNSASGDAVFFYYRDGLYLKDTVNIYRITSNSVSVVEGYVPLYGKDWSTSVAGEVYQPLNLLHRKARISYKVPETHTAMLPTGMPVVSVISLHRNGVLVASSEYSFDSKYNTINVQEISAGDQFVAVVEFEADSSAQTSILMSSPHSAIYGGVKNSRLFFWGSASAPSSIFASTYVSNADLAESEALCAGHGHLYFVADDQFIVGDGNGAVKAITRHYDRLLIFTENDAWMADSSVSETDDFPTMNINSRAGCASVNGAVLVGNDPITVGNHCIFQWTSDTDEINECNAYSISDGINELLEDGFFKNAAVFHDARRNEILFHNTQGDGSVWLYNTVKKAWYKFTNIPVTRFFDNDGKLCFYHEYYIYQFFEDVDKDVDPNGSEFEITATFKSGILSFDTTDIKRLSVAKVIGDLLDSKLNLILTCDTGETVDFSVYGDDGHTVDVRRLNSGRFTNLELALTSNGKARQTIHCLKIDARLKR